MTEPKPYMHAIEVARLFRVSPKTISRWAREGVTVDGQLITLDFSVTAGGHRRYSRRAALALAAQFGITEDSQEGAA